MMHRIIARRNFRKLSSIWNSSSEFFFENLPFIFLYLALGVFVYLGVLVYKEERFYNYNPCPEGNVKLFYSEIGQCVYKTGKGFDRCRSAVFTLNCEIKGEIEIPLGSDILDEGIGVQDDKNN